MNELVSSLWFIVCIFAGFLLVGKNPVEPNCYPWRGNLTIQYIPQFWWFMYGLFLNSDCVCTVFSSFLTVHLWYIPHWWQCMYSIFLISDSVCIVYSSFLTVYVQYILHFWWWMYDIFLISDSVCKRELLFMYIWPVQTFMSMPKKYTSGVTKKYFLFDSSTRY